MCLKQNLNRSIISMIHLWDFFFFKAKHISVLWYQMIKEGLLNYSKLG